MSNTIYYIICAILSVGVLTGISLMSKVKTAVNGNMLSAVCVFLGVFVTLLYNEVLTVWSIYIFILMGIIIGSALANRVKMIQMPQFVALLNGVGGFASSMVGILTLLGVGLASDKYPAFVNITSVLAIIVGNITLSGSLVAAGKLHKKLPQKPIIWKNHPTILNICLLILLSAVLYSAFQSTSSEQMTGTYMLLIVSLTISLLFGAAFSIRVGGADMPITISLLNSLSGVAGAIAGMAVNDLLLVAVGGIVGASGLFLTQIMCKSMNRSLADILTGKTSSMRAKTKGNVTKNGVNVSEILSANKVTITESEIPSDIKVDITDTEILSDQTETKVGVNELSDNKADKTDTETLSVNNEALTGISKGINVSEIQSTNKVTNTESEIQSDLTETKFGANELSDNKADITELQKPTDQTETIVEIDESTNPKDILTAAKTVIIVPGYGMALAQAQHLVRELADKLENNGASVKYAIHPVAGRMPGHMNVLLAEADVSYEQLYEMDSVNDEFAQTDVAIVIGANDVLNPSARDAVDTPIYGMPVLNVDEARQIFICNYDLNPGYSGVDNPLYTRIKGVHLFLGDAKESLALLISFLS